MTESLATFSVASINDPFGGDLATQLADALPGYVTSRRWFRAKARSVRKLAVEDVVPMSGGRTYILVLHIEYAEGEPDRYVLPLTLAEDASVERDEVVAKLTDANGQSGLLFSALNDAEFRDELIQAIACDKSSEGRLGAWQATRTSAFQMECDSEAPKLESFVSRAEQSNTSIVYRNRFILKLFRKLEQGVNPDLEIGRFLTERGFRNTPTALGSLTYQSKANGEEFGAGILQAFVANKGDVWAYTLESLEGFFSRALKGESEPPEREGGDPIERMQQPVSSEAGSLIGGYLDAAALLGQRTAQMHAALADPGGGADFAPEVFTAADGEKLYTDLLDQAATTFALLRQKQDALSGDLAGKVRVLIALEPTVTKRLQEFENKPSTAKRIRHHGDYHLGQVLFTGDDFMIIDFEGEPARALTERRAKSLALRDVAGMLRSFEYAAFAVLFGQVPGVRVTSETRGAIENWAAVWNDAVSTAFLRGYFEESGPAEFIPASWSERKLFLDAFLLQKALYEVAYELNNRPDWLQIPVGGILNLLGTMS